MKKFVLPLIALALFASPLLAQQDSAPGDHAQQDNASQDNVVEEIIARVNNAIITRADLRRNHEQIAVDARDQHFGQSQIEEREKNSLRDLIDQQLLVQKAAELGISADADLVKRLDDLRKQLKANSLEELQKIAESQGVSWEDFKQNTKNGILTQKVIGSEVGARIQITQQEAQKFYDQHKADFTQPERVRLSEILIANDPDAPKGSAVDASPEQVAAAQAKANEIYQQLKGGASFEELARKVSSGTTADQGGDLGYFKRNDLAKQLEDQTFGLKSGDFTQPIHTRQGFIILRVDDHIDAGTPPFERVREQIQEQLYGQRVQPALREYLTKLREDAYIDVKAGYTDTGASPNESKLIYATDIGPRTKQVRSKFGMGKKKTVVVTGEDKNDHAAPTGSTSEIGSAKAEVDAKQKAAEERKAAVDAAAAAAAAKAAEKEKLSHMTRQERKKYLAEKKREAKKEAKLKRQEARKQQTVADQEAQRKAEQAKAAKAAKSKKPGKKAKEPKQEAKAESSQQADSSSQQADSSQPPKKKKISWF